jgi:hypothetical protein
MCDLAPKRRYYTLCGFRTRDLDIATFLEVAALYLLS